jgi:hypothetical protein
MGDGLGWTPAFSSAVIAHSIDDGFVEREGEQLLLTELGREAARQTLGGV